jgi:hypothetical protein
MADSAEQAQKFQEFCKSWSDDCSTHWHEAFHSWLQFQKHLAAQYEDLLKDERRDLDKFSSSEYAKTMMHSYLSAVSFQREQIGILMNSQAHWSERYRRFLDSLDQEAGATPSDVQQ